MRYVNVKENNQICSPLKTSQQVTLNKAHVIEITKLLLHAQLFLWKQEVEMQRETKKKKKIKTKTSKEKNHPEDSENAFFKALTNRF